MLRYLARKTLILTLHIHFLRRVYKITVLNAIILITIYLYMLRTFANSRKAPVTFVMPVRPYQCGSQWTDFRRILYLGLLWKFVEEFQIC